MTCNWCHLKPSMNDIHIDDFAVGVYGYCTNPSCAAYALLQVPQEMMPQPRKYTVTALSESGETVSVNIPPQKPSKVRREKKEVTGVFGGIGTATCGHEFTLRAYGVKGRTYYYSKCKRCHGVLMTDGEVLFS